MNVLVKCESPMCVFSSERKPASAFGKGCCGGLLCLNGFFGSALTPADVMTP